MKQNKISGSQLTALIVLGSFGTEVLALPGRVYNISGGSSILSVIMAWLFAFVSVFMISKLCQRFPNRSFYGFTAIITCRPVALLLSAGLFFYIITVTSLRLAHFCQFIKGGLLRSTPLWVTALVMVVICAYAASKGIETRARAAQALIPLVFVPLVIVFIRAAIGADYTNILPLNKYPVENILGAGVAAYPSFLGLEFLLLSYPYMAKSREGFSASFKAVAVIGAILFLLTVVTIAALGTKTGQRQWPALHMLTGFKPGSLIERQEALVISFWIVGVFALINAGLFFSSHMVSAENKVLPAVVIIVLALTLSFLIWEVDEKVVALAGGVYTLVIPALLLATAKIRGIKDSEYD